MSKTKTPSQLATAKVKAENYIQQKNKKNKKWENKMKKSDFVRLYIKPYLRINDKPANRELWNSQIDFFLKSEQIPKRAENWIKTPKKHYGEN